VATGCAKASAGATADGTYRTDLPRLSKKAGNYSSAITVRLKDRTHGAAIYYSTDGWNPTRSAERYTGPITIDATTTLEAIAIAPDLQLRRGFGHLHVSRFCP
jgi:hypothetical protein